MYGSEETDLVVKYYDEAFGVGDQDDYGWYRDKVKAAGGGPILELCCGTGRIALRLAKEEGYDVTGIDQSVGMLNQFQNKLDKVAPEVRQRVHISRPQRMSDFSMPNNKKFNTIICCDAFFHNLTVEEQMGCLRCVRQHLKAGGGSRFLFNIGHETCEYILDSASPEGKIFYVQGRYPLENSNGETLLVERALDGSILEQTITTTLRITRFAAADAQGNQQVLEQSADQSWTIRYLFRYEAVHLLYRCGFEVVSLVGDYSNGPVTEKGELIFEVKLKDETNKEE